eukprot:TRINITY_DN221_c0_g1_i2.p2 TRINITY_DN221_c0_g1~~TRINITY_DN221_c0_g1_i2.p2  ORF type:complete len:274 (+),score=83.53 TRINITY_DN221_c0_g1_i2:313-1134(+)
MARKIEKCGGSIVIVGPGKEGFAELLEKGLVPENARVFVDERPENAEYAQNQPEIESEMRENDEKMRENGPEMTENEAKMSENGRKMGENETEMSENDAKMSENGKKRARGGDDDGDDDNNDDKTKSAAEKARFSAVSARFSALPARFSAFSGENRTFSGEKRPETALSRAFSLLATADRPFFKAFGAQNGELSGFLSSTLWKRVVFSPDWGDLTLKGAMQLGGTFVVHSERGLLYARRQRTYEDYPNRDDLRELCAAVAGASAADAAAGNRK